MPGARKVTTQDIADVLQRVEDTLGSDDANLLLAVLESQGFLLSAYQQLAARTAGAGGDGERRQLVAALGLCGEAGELGDLIKKKIAHGHQVSDGEIAEELGDVMWYVAEVASAFGLNLGQVALANVQKLEARYPDGFDQERSQQ